MFDGQPTALSVLMNCINKINGHVQNELQTQCLLPILIMVHVRPEPLTLCTDIPTLSELLRLTMTKGPK